MERVNRLSPEDKLAIALHDFPAVTAQDFVPFDYCDGPNGVRGHSVATAFPSALALAASFDRALAGQYGAALGREVLGAGKNAILAPGLDIARVPQGGRAGESLGEDPILAGEIGGAVGAGIQAEGVIAVAKHYVADNFEWLRTGESMDADGLILPGTQAAFITAVAAANPHTVVVTLGAGPVVMPWWDSVPAVIHAWFPGEQFAPALADVLTGRAEPGGRLPITFPTDERTTPIQEPGQYPGIGGVATYAEELLVGYRWYQDRGIKPAYPFGHGLGYTSFDFEDLRAEVRGAGIDLIFHIRNVGPRPGKAIPQIYISYPSNADEPPAQLKAFDVVRLGPGKARQVKINISYDDLAIFDELSNHVSCRLEGTRSASVPRRQNYH